MGDMDNSAEDFEAPPPDDCMVSNSKLKENTKN